MFVRAPRRQVANVAEAGEGLSVLLLVRDGRSPTAGWPDGGTAALLRTAREPPRAASIRRSRFTMLFQAFVSDSARPPWRNVRDRL
jgi:hypothetical protein